MYFDDTFDERETNSRTLAQGIQLMEDSKYPLGKARLDTHAVIADIENRDGPRLTPLTNLDLLVRLFAHEFDTFKEFPPSQQVGTFGLDKVMKMLAEPPSGHD